MKSNTLMMLAYFTVGLLSGWLVANSKTKQAQHIDTEYYIELRADNSAIIEGIDGHTYVCPIDSIPIVLHKDNL